MRRPRLPILLSLLTASAALGQRPAFVDLREWPTPARRAAGAEPTYDVRGEILAGWEKCGAGGKFGRAVADVRPTDDQRGEIGRFEHGIIRGYPEKGASVEFR